MRLLVILLLTSLAISETVSVKLKDGFIPKNSFGLVVANNSTRLTTSSLLSLDESKQGVFDISLPEGAELFSGVIISESGETITLPLKKSSSPILPMCPETFDKAHADQTALLQSLIGLRVEKRGLLKKKVEEVLDPTFSEKLTRLEQAFGLSQDIPINANIDPYTLSERLSLLAVVLGNLEEKK